MKKRIYVIPCDLPVFNPITGKNLHRSGEYVECSPFWDEKIKNKEVVQYGPEEDVPKVILRKRIVN